MSFAEDFELYRQNILPSMLEVLASDLNVSISSLQSLGVGFYPAKQSWVFAERDHNGEIIGLSLRSLTDGKKYMVEGSKRGLIYPYNEAYIEGEHKYDPGRCHWVRIQEAGVVCPVCGKPDWCMVSSDNPKDPSAVLCSRISEKSIRSISTAGFLHVRKNTRDIQRKSVLANCETDVPIIVCEGASDVLAALDIGFVAIGKPSAKGGMDELKQMPLAGKEVWIIGENDAGAGKEGMDKTFLNLKDLTDKIMCVMPPEGIKDLRQWVNSGITQESLLTYVSQFGRSPDTDPTIFADDVARTISKRFLEDHSLDGIRTLRRYHANWYEWATGKYNEVKQDDLRGKLYRYLDGKQCIIETAKEIKVAPYKPTGRKVSDIIDAMNGEPAIHGMIPIWTEQRGRPDTRNLISFTNGILDVDEFCKGNIVMLDPTPELFTLATIPYDYDPKAWSTFIKEYCKDTFNGDDDTIRLLAQWWGYNLVHDLSLEKFAIFIGPTRSGKSTLLSAMKAMLGREQCGSTSFSTLASPFGLSSLIGKSTVIAGDVKAARKAEIDTALEAILRIVGQDSVPINRKYADLYDADLTCRFTLAMNELPMFSDNSKAIVARALLMCFPNSYVGREDPNLKRRLIQEAGDGKLINFALWGLKDLRNSGGFADPEISKRERAQMIALTSPITAFTSECCLISRDVEIDKMQMYEAWKTWCHDCGRKYSNNIHFSRWLLQEVPSVEIKVRRSGKDRERVFKGITLTSMAYNRLLGRP